MRGARTHGAHIAAIHAATVAGGGPSCRGRGTSRPRRAILSPSDRAFCLHGGSGRSPQRPWPRGRDAIPGLAPQRRRARERRRAAAAAACGRTARSLSHRPRAGPARQRTGLARRFLRGRGSCRLYRRSIISRRPRPSRVSDLPMSSPAQPGYLASDCLSCLQARSPAPCSIRPTPRAISWRWSAPSSGLTDRRKPG